MTSEAYECLLAGAKLVLRQINGTGRGDGYDVYVYVLRSGRYLVEVTSVSDAKIRRYLCPSLTDALGIVASGYTPGYGPGRARAVKAWWRLNEAKQRADRLVGWP